MIASDYVKELKGSNNKTELDNTFISINHSEADIHSNYFYSDKSYIEEENPNKIEVIRRDSLFSKIVQFQYESIKYRLKKNYFNFDEK